MLPPRNNMKNTSHLLWTYLLTCPCPIAAVLVGQENGWLHAAAVTHLACGG